MTTHPKYDERKTWRKFIGSGAALDSAATVFSVSSDCSTVIMSNRDTWPELARGHVEAFVQAAPPNKPTTRLKMLLHSLVAMRVLLARGDDESLFQVLRQSFGSGSLEEQRIQLLMPRARDIVEFSQAVPDSEWSWRYFEFRSVIDNFLPHDPAPAPEDEAGAGRGGGSTDVNRSRSGPSVAHIGVPGAGSGGASPGDGSALTGHEPDRNRCADDGSRPRDFHSVGSRDEWSGLANHVPLEGLRAIEDIDQSQHSNANRVADESPARSRRSLTTHALGKDVGEHQNGGVDNEETSGGGGGGVNSGQASTLSTHSGDSHDKRKSPANNGASKRACLGGDSNDEKKKGITTNENTKQQANC